MKTLKKFEFVATTANRSTHNWEKIFDGGLYHLTPGTEAEVAEGKADYDCKDSTFTMMVRDRAARRGFAVLINKVKEGGFVVQAGLSIETANGKSKINSPGTPDVEAGKAYVAHQKDLAAARKAKKAAEGETTEDEVTAVEGEDEGGDEAAE